MSNEPRKATEVLLDIESKIDILLNIVRNQDLNIKVLSNKLNNLNIIKPIGVPTVEISNFTTTSESQIQIPISTDTQIIVDKNPQGFRRISRPETYSGDNVYLSKTEKKPEAK